MFGLVEIIILLVAVAGSGITAAFYMWLINRLRDVDRRIEASANPQLLADLETEVQRLHATVDQLAERTEFAERLLEGKTGGATRPPTGETGSNT